MLNTFILKLDEKLNEVGDIGISSILSLQGDKIILGHTISELDSLKSIDTGVGSFKLLLFSSSFKTNFESVSLFVSSTVSIMTE